MTRKTAVAVLLAAATCSACLVDVQHVSDPRPYFDKAHAEARAFQGRPGPAHEVNVLVYDPKDRSLVRVSAPMWLARKLGHDVDIGNDEDSSAEDRATRAVRRHVSLQDLERAGLGVLVEVEAEEGEQVLVWLR